MSPDTTSKSHRTKFSDIPDEATEQTLHTQDLEDLVRAIAAISVNSCNLISLTQSQRTFSCSLVPSGELTLIILIKYESQNYS